ncbi:ABC transporter substrate-binding protein [Microbacterium album]|uniref:ABC transporter substrate-binding protein n=1 Tax=Microbacterium album TaxID=2053191 RepID=UPI00166959A8|nr:ABC transporter substrate-binding protein [Microbacterium album]
MSAIAACVAIGAAVLTGCGSSADASGSPAETVAVSVGVTPIANAATVYLAEELGYFADENLDVTPTIIQAAAAAIPSLQNDELQFALVSAVPTITAASKGLPIRVVASNDRYNPDPEAVDGAALVASATSGVTSPSELAGATIAVVGLKSAPELALRLALRGAGVDPESVEVVEIPYPDMVSALTSDRVDAAIVADPFLSQAKAAGLPVVSQPFLDALHGEAGTTWVASERFLQAHPDAGQAFVRAITKAVAYAAANPDAVRDIMGSYTEISPEARAAAVLPYFDSTIDGEDLQFFADALVTEEFIDSAYDASGLLWTLDR